MLNVLVLFVFDIRSVNVDIALHLLVFSMEMYFFKRNIDGFVYVA